MTDPSPADSPLRYGVGARVTAAVMSDDYIALLTDVLTAVDTTGLLVETGDVSTYLGGHEHDLQRALIDLAAALASTEHHVSLTIVLSRGCPGEVACEARGAAGTRAVPAPGAPATGRYASAEWALYPLADRGTDLGEEPDHMRDIHAAIDHAKELGTFAGSEHFVTRLEGDLGAVIATAVAGWLLVGRSVQHVTTHLTVSINSPSHTARTLNHDGLEAEGHDSTGTSRAETAEPQGTDAAQEGQR